MTDEHPTMSNSNSHTDTDTDTDIDIDLQTLMEHMEDWVQTENLLLHQFDLEEEKEEDDTPQSLLDEHEHRYAHTESRKNAATEMVKHQSPALGSVIKEFSEGDYCGRVDKDAFDNFVDYQDDSMHHIPTNSNCDHQINHATQSQQDQQQQQQINLSFMNAGMSRVGFENNQQNGNDQNGCRNKKQRVDLSRPYIVNHFSHFQMNQSNSSSNNVDSTNRNYLQNPSVRQGMGNNFVYDLTDSNMHLQEQWQQRENTTYLQQQQYQQQSCTPIHSSGSLRYPLSQYHQNADQNHIKQPQFNLAAKILPDANHFSSKQSTNKRSLSLGWAMHNGAVFNDVTVLPPLSAKNQCTYGQRKNISKNAHQYSCYYRNRSKGENSTV